MLKWNCSVANGLMMMIILVIIQNAATLQATPKDSGASEPPQRACEWKDSWNSNTGGWLMSGGMYCDVYNQSKLYTNFSKG